LLHRSDTADWTSQVVGCKTGYVHSVAVDDFDGNGDLDIVSGAYSREIWVCGNRVVCCVGGYAVSTRRYDLLVSWLKSVLSMLR
jgi:hypothetical protein